MRVSSLEPSWQAKKKILFGKFGFVATSVTPGHTFPGLTIVNDSMQTRSSSPLQPHEAPPLPAPPEAPAKAQWTEADEITLIDYITEHKAEAGDGMKFKSSFWTGAAKEMISHSNLGGVKTPQGCSSKWDQVCFILKILQVFLLT
jgi:hypothetical protein